MERGEENVGKTEDGSAALVMKTEGCRKELAAGGEGGIDKARFGSFVTELRREKGYTQKQLAERLYISDKAISKWERALSLPDITLLEPLAKILGVTVTELLHGERISAGAGGEGELTESEIERLLKNSGEMSGEERARLRSVRRKRGKWYLTGAAAAVAETVLLWVFGSYMGITTFDILLDMLIMEPLVLFLGIWPFFFMPERLPDIYDRVRINTYGDGFFRIEMGGIYFNNRNWPHITKALRSYCFLMPVCWPVCYVLLRLVIPDFIWLYGRIAVLLAVVLGGLFIPVAVLGKRYESETP